MSNNNNSENGPKAFSNHTGPDPDLLKPGSGVYVKWSNGVIYKGTIMRKLRKNYEVEINDSRWYYAHKLASVPPYALIPNRYPDASIRGHEEIQVTSKYYN